VNAVKFIRTASGTLLLSGSVDKSIRVWHHTEGSKTTNGYSISSEYHCIQVMNEHQGSVNCIAVTQGATIFATGAADATVKIWGLNPTGKDPIVRLLQSIQVTPRFFPLALAFSPLGVEGTENAYLLAVAGTAAIVQLYVANSKGGSGFEFQLKATLSGHEGWIRSLSFTHESEPPMSDLLLASASQDKYIRLWRIHQGKELPAAAAAGSDPALGDFLPGKSLSNKAHRFLAGEEDYSATFEALLLGHEDWIYSLSWRSKGEKLQLLSASADNSLAIWEQDPSSSVWVTVARLGEISAQKGSTTATGSTGGFWTGLWSPSGDTVTCLGRTGSWRVWSYDNEQDRWGQEVGISGHTQAVTGIAWSKYGDYLLSTSSDQTTRLHAKWKRHGEETWHEMARPQIHGYDINCIDTIGESKFVSGADEKLLRVFTEPRAVADLLQKLCGISSSRIEDLPDAANMPVLGLSNKAVEAVSDSADVEEKNGIESDVVDSSSNAFKSILNIDHPPLEDHLSRHTLWPEIEKLYGHGYEISALAASHDGSLIATACKASSIDHAVIRLYTTHGWREVKPPLTAHSLTVTRVRFSPDDRYLLSVGRDRQWAVFEKSEKGYELSEANVKGHARMILDAAWMPVERRAFATAGRDKLIKLWGKNSDDTGFVCINTITAEFPVTAVDIVDTILQDKATYLAVGTEIGQLLVYRISLKDLVLVEKFVMPTK
jgi:elongator complex protein 2